MKKEIVIIILLFALSGVNLWLNLRKDETQTTEINYDLYRYKSQQLESLIDSLSNEVIVFKNSIDTVKLQILRDETTIKNLDNNGIDSAFAVLLQSTR